MVPYVFSKQHLFYGEADVLDLELWPLNTTARTPTDKSVQGT